MVELVDTRDLKSLDRKIVRVQVPPSAPLLTSLHMYDGIIFDLDGTLWDAVPTTAKGWNKGLENLGLEKRVSVEEIMAITGKPAQECLDIIFSDLYSSHPDICNIMNRYEEDALKKYGGQIYPGVKESLPELSQNFPLFIVSNCTEWYLELFFNFSGLKKYFKAWDCAGMSNAPKSEMLKNMATHNKLANTVYVGDTAGDESAAKAAKIPLLYASYGFGECKDYLAACNSFQEVIEQLKTS